MRLKELDWPIYSTSFAYLTILHFTAFIVGLLTNQWLLLLSFGYFVLMIPASGISLLIFRLSLPLLSKCTGVGELLTGVGMLAMGSCIAGGLAFTALISLLWDDNFFSALWYYLPFPVLATLLAVIRKRKLIKANF